MNVRPETEWRLVRLGDVCEIQLGKMLSSAFQTGTRPRFYLRNANVQWGRFDLSDVYQMDFTEAEEAKFALREGDLLVCEGGEPGRAAVWNEQIKPCYYQKALHRLRPINEAVDPYFIMYRLWKGAFQGEFLDAQTKNTIAHLPADRLAELQIKLPSIYEQREVVQQISESMVKLHRIKTAAERQQEAITALRAAIVNEALNRIETDFGQLRRVLSIEPQNGWSPSESSSGTPVLTLSAVTGFDYDGTKIKFTDAYVNETAHYWAAEGDLLISRSNTSSLVGHAAICDGIPERVIFPDLIMRTRVNPTEGDVRFVHYWFMGSIARRYLEEKARGTSNSMKKITKDVVLSLPFPSKLSAEVQSQIADDIDGQILSQKTMTGAAKLQTEAINALPATILKEVFGQFTSR